MQSGNSEGNFENGRRQARGGRLLWLATGCLLAFVCVACMVTITAAGFIIVNRYERDASQLLASSDESLTPSAPLLPTHVASPTMSPAAPDQPTPGEAQTLATATSVPTATATPYNLVPPEIGQDTPPANAMQYLLALMAADYPARDYYEAASRLGHMEVGKRTVIAQEFQVGDRKNFSTDDGLREAVLLAVTEHAYFWVESTLDYDPQLVQEAAQQFESEYLPPLIKLYGSDWQLGIDDDPKFSALHLNGYADGTELGFFNSGDQYPQSINASSNEQEVVYLNMENLKVGEPLYYGTLVHELQHLILWQSDPNEPVWLSEGLAQFTELYAGLDTVDTSFDYLVAPETRLNTWLYDDDDEVFAHYGAAYLFVVYFWERFGDQAVQALMRQPADGLAGFSAVLAEQDPALSMDQFVLDWATANYLDNPAYGSIYSYDHLALDEARASNVVRRSPFEVMDDIDQFGVSYIDLNLSGQHALSFAGDSLAELIPAAPHSGEAMWFVPALDELDAQLTASFDLTGLTQADLNFWAWYDLEDDYDFAYVSASDDGGLTWDVLMPTHAQAGEYGPGLTGRSVVAGKANGGWVQETVSLSAYAGGPVMIRFEVLSDSAIAETGFAVDDIAISELNYLDDVETGDGVWQARGFVRTGYQVPQIWRLNLILPGPSPRVEALDLDSRSQGTWTVDFGDRGGTLVITAQTPFVSDPASYWLAVDRQN